MSEAVGVRRVEIRAEDTRDPLVHRGGEDLPDGMDGIVPRKTLGAQAAQRSNDFGLVGGELVLHDGVDDRVQVGVGKPDPSAAVVQLNEGDSLALVEFEPPLGIDGAVRIVFLQLFTLPNESRLSYGRACITLAAT